jgi:CBS-domain-containing membrane protein
MAVKTKDNRKNAVLIPALLVGISLMALVAALSYMNLDLRYGAGYSTVIFASFGGSAFLLFMMPKSKASSIKRFIKSYMIAGIMGAMGYYILQYFGMYIAVGVIMFMSSVILVKMDSMHPPAMGIAFAFILYHIDYLGVLIIASSVIIMVLIRIVLERAAFIVEKDFEEIEGRM